MERVREVAVLLAALTVLVVLLAYSRGFAAEPLRAGSCGVFAGNVGPCAQRGIAAQRAGKQWRLYREFALDDLRSRCDVDPDTRTVSCVVPASWLTVCDAEDCELKVELGR